MKQALIKICVLAWKVFLQFDPAQKPAKLLIWYLK